MSLYDRGESYTYATGGNVDPALAAICEATREDVQDLEAFSGGAFDCCPVCGKLANEHPDVAYEQAFGAEKARGQEALYRLNHACNCGQKKYHKPGCPKAKRNR